MQVSYYIKMYFVKLLVVELADVGDINVYRLTVTLPIVVGVWPMAILLRQHIAVAILGFGQWGC